MSSWSMFLLYKKFHDFGLDIGLSTESIVDNWRNLRYHMWHVDRGPFLNEDDE